jgi:hypothetical protein
VGVTSGHAMLLLLVALVLAVFGVVRFGRTLEPGGQRWMLALVFLLGLIWLAFTLVNAGFLGRVAE